MDPHTEGSASMPVALEDVTYKATQACQQNEEDAIKATRNKKDAQEAVPVIS
jgi:hypothetical protein